MDDITSLQEVAVKQTRKKKVSADLNYKKLGLELYGLGCVCVGKHLNNE